MSDSKISENRKKAALKSLKEIQDIFKKSGIPRKEFKIRS